MEEVITWVDLLDEDDDEASFEVDADWMGDWERLFRLAARATRTKMSSWPSAQRLIDEDDAVKGDFQLMAVTRRGGLQSATCFDRHRPVPNHSPSSDLVKMSSSSKLPMRPVNNGR